MVRLATVGTSSIVHRALSAMRTVPGLEHVGAYSRDLDRAGELVGRPAALVFDDLDELATSPLLDAVYVASPNALHAGQVAVLLEGGKHVLVEKSATTNAREFSGLRELAARRGVVLMEASRNGGYDPGVAQLRDLLAEVGTVRQVRLEYAQRSSRYDRFLAGEHVNIFDPAMSAGALMDLGVYCAHLAVELFGSPDQVVAARMSRLRGGIDGAGVAVLGYGDATVTLAYSKISDSHVGSEIQGEDATVVLDAVADPRSLSLVSRTGVRTDVMVDKPPDNMACEFVEFHRLVRGGTDPARWNDVTERRLRLTDEIRSRLGLRFAADDGPLQLS
jgi:predicted dehydrogenase